MLSIRQEVNNEILRYMESEGYHLAPGSKTPHTLDSWVFHYTNAAGNNDGIKIEINYSDRCHIQPAIETHVSIPFLSDVKVRSLSPVELFATKINALIGRSAARDIYDVYNMMKHQLFVSDEEKTLLRKRPFLSDCWLKQKRQRYAYGIYRLSADRQDPFSADSFATLACT